MQIQTLEKLRKQQVTIENQIKHAEVDMEQYEQELKNARNKLNELEGFSAVKMIIYDPITAVFYIV